MGSADLDQRISSFLNRKHAEYPELATDGRHESRTMKYAAELRAHGQLLMTR